MIYAIIMLVLFSAVLLLFDHQSRYSLLFVMMAMGCALALFALVLHINVFGNYYSYSGSLLFHLDYRIYSYIVTNIRFPFPTVIRFTNAGHVLYILSNILFTIEVRKGMAMYTHKSRRFVFLRILAVALPLFSFAFCDPTTSTRLYLLCHRSPSVYAWLVLGTLLYKTIVIVTILSTVYSLLRYGFMMHIHYLKHRILALAAAMLAVHIGYISMFYLGPFSISHEKVWRSGFWYFENAQLSSHSIYLLVSVGVLVLMAICLVVLLTFRLDFSTTLFLEKKVRRNLKLMNETLGDTLHSHKNTLFSIQLQVRKAQRKLGEAGGRELERIGELVDGALEQTARMLDNLGAVKYRFLRSDLSQIIQAAARQVFIPEHIKLVLDDSTEIRQMGYYDRYHMEKALVNILGNAVEAVQESGKEKGLITVEMAFFFRWVVVLITDNGTGISRSKRKKLFMPHYSNKDGRLNWGLGLAYVYKIVKAHFGQIKINSHVGEYTEVLIMLPVARRGRGE